MTLRSKMRVFLIVAVFSLAPACVNTADIEQGSHLGRLVVGFGVGRSSMDAVVHVLAPGEKKIPDLIQKKRRLPCPNPHLNLALK